MYNYQKFLCLWELCTFFEDDFNALDETIVAGDFNLPILEWVDDNETIFDACNVCFKKESVFIDGCSDLDLNQICNFEYNYDHVLDLVFVSFIDNILIEVYLVCDLQSKDTSMDYWIYDFHNGDYDNILTRLFHNLIGTPCNEVYTTW